ncbi:hypothetical protein PVBG_06241 [Plasmodium vivax Brazil I]|uniref:VIR protein n=1 Tax=Plasmodium vivax (strain Brazil I) TaxID=1033975 RepID=A0A0J9SLA4_PLAV1|nr:hypothetical protein PVBG_06241 [Plasmodium vivax Brazil I]
MNKKGKKEQYNLCKKVCYILQFSENIQSISESINNDKLCLYVNLWLYHHATKIPDFPERIDILYKALNLIKKKRDNKVNQCNLTDYSISNSEFKHKQILFEFFENYENLKKMLESQDDINVQLYCNHIKKHFLYYNNIKETCVPENSCKFHDELKNFKEKFSNPVDLKLIYEKCDYEKTLCEKGSNGENDVPCLKEKGYSFLYLIFGNDADNIINILLKVTTISAPILTLFVILFRVLTFEKYIDFQEKFGNVQNFSSDSVNVNMILDKANITGNDKENYKKAFDILLNHIHRDGLFTHDENPEACKYINYILYEQVERKDHRSYNEELIKLFHKFLVAYGEIRSKQNRCVSKIYSIDDKTYNKINELYKVYDKYKLCYRFNKDRIKWGCDKFEDFFDSYDKYMLGIESNSLAFNNILQKIQQDAENALSLYRNEKECIKYKKDLQSPRLFKAPPKPEIPKQVQMRETRLQSVDNIPQYETHAKTHTLQTQLTEVIPISQTIQENQATHEGNSANDDHGSNDIHRVFLQNETTYPLMREDEEKTQRLLRSQPPFRHLYSSGTSLYPRQHGHEEEKVISNEVEMSPPSVMSTITSALKDVDPAPVLGVSGGMGVLFILFKVFNDLKI